MAEPTGQERYEYWLRKAREKGDVFTTRTKAVMKDFFLIKERRENDGLVLPPDVEERRKTNDSLRRVEAKLDEIKKDTTKSSSILKTWVNMIKQGAKDLRD